MGKLKYHSQEFNCEYCKYCTDIPLEPDNPRKADGISDNISEIFCGIKKRRKQYDATCKLFEGV